MQCSEEFKELLAQPTFGARNLCKHWTKADAEKKQGANFQSVSASALLKQQKQKLLEARKKRSEEIQRRFVLKGVEGVSPEGCRNQREMDLEKLKMSISRHFASSECYYIDVKNMSQVHLEKEVIDFGHAKYKVTSASDLAGVWKK